MPSTSWTTTMGRKLFWLVFAAALLARLYQLPARAIFTADEEYQATYAQTIVDDFHPVWIGVSAADTGFYLGPYFTYLTAGLLKLSGGDPLVLNYAAAVLGALTAGLLYLLGSSLFGKRVGLIAAILYSLSPLLVYFDQRYWNPSPIPFLTVLLLWSLYQLRSQPWWLVGVALILGAVWHVHLSLFPLLILALYLVWRQRKRIPVKIWLVSLLAYTVMVLPLLIFDYYHDWSNLTTPLRLISRGGQGINIIHNLELLGMTLARSLYLLPGYSNDAEVKFNCPGENTVLPLAFLFLSSLPLLFFLFRSQQGKAPVRASILLLSAAFVLYPGPVASYYALGLLPLYFLALAHQCRRFWWLVLPVFLVLSLKTLLATDPGYGLAAKRALISSVMQRVGDQPFIVQESGTCHAYAGWRFLFLSYGQSPAASSADASLGWLYPSEIRTDAVYLVTLGNKREFNPPLDALSVLESGHYNAYITKITHEQ